MTKLILAVSALAVAGAAFAQGGSSQQNGSDAQTAAMIQAINKAEISQAKIAEKSAKSPAVKQFARMMIRDHGKNNADLAMVEKRDAIQPETTNVVQALTSQTHQTTQQLESQTGSDFDAAYIQAQVQEHQDGLKKLDQAISSSSSDSFRQFVKKTRQTVAHHLAEAKSLQAKLGASTQPSGGNQ